MVYQANLAPDEKSWVCTGKIDLPTDPNKALNLVPFEKTSSGVFVFSDDKDNYFIFEAEEMSSQLLQDVNTFFSESFHVR